MDDPYRGSVFGTCPRCGTALLGDLVGRLECPEGCGEWLTTEMLGDAVTAEALARCEPDVGSLIGRPFPPGRCAMCPRSMDVRIKHRAVFDWCRDHGVWLDRGESRAFEAAFDLASRVQRR